MGAISVEDKDEDTLVYSIASGYNGNRFSIDSGWLSNIESHFHN